MRSKRIICPMRHTLRLSRLWKILLKTLFAVPLSARFFILPSVLLFGSVEAMQAQTEHLLCCRQRHSSDTPKRSTKAQAPSWGDCVNRLAQLPSG